MQNPPEDIPGFLKEFQPQPNEKPEDHAKRIFGFMKDLGRQMRRDRTKQQRELVNIAENATSWTPLPVSTEDDDTTVIALLLRGYQVIPLKNPDGEIFWFTNGQKFDPLPNGITDYTCLKAAVPLSLAEVRVLLGLHTAVANNWGYGGLQHTGYIWCDCNLNQLLVQGVVTPRLLLALNSLLNFNPRKLIVHGGLLNPGYRAKLVGTKLTFRQGDPQVLTNFLASAELDDPDERITAFEPFLKDYERVFGDTANSFRVILKPNNNPLCWLIAPEAERLIADQWTHLTDELHPDEIQELPDRSLIYKRGDVEVILAFEEDDFYDYEDALLENTYRSLFFLPQSISPTIETNHVPKAFWKAQMLGRIFLDTLQTSHEYKTDDEPEALQAKLHEGPRLLAARRLIEEAGLKQIAFRFQTLNTKLIEDTWGEFGDLIEKLHENVVALQK